jgi:hypothetical protein
MGHSKKETKIDLSMRGLQNNEKVKVTLRIEKEGKYYQRTINPEWICAMADLQYMIDSSWDTIELNGLEQTVGEFFKIMDIFDGIWHGNNTYRLDLDNKLKKTKHKYYPWGVKPRWKKIKE